jgi:PAS domain S-box-containing protein
VSANATVLKRYGLEREQLIGNSLFRMGFGMAPGDRAHLLENLRRGDSVRDLELDVRAANGQTQHLLLNAEPISYRGRRCALTASMDLTARVQAEDDRRARQAAEAASEAKTTFLSRMSHELRTPLNAVIGFAQLLESNPALPLAREQAAQVEAIRRAGWHLLALINDVLDVSRIESGRLHLEQGSVDLLAVLDSALEIVGAQARQHGVALHASYRRDPPCFVQGDPVRLRQVALNLVSNAVKYNRRGGEVRLDVEQRGRHVDWTVRDNGLGMTPEQVQLLFQPFNRLGRERTTIEGSGIGLALAKQLIELMGGQIEVVSRVDQGTTMTVRLRAATPPPGPDTAPADAAGSPDGEPRGCVLYVEDNPVNTMIVQAILSRWPASSCTMSTTAATASRWRRACSPTSCCSTWRCPT